jgi:hypothetical protein
MPLSPDGVMLSLTEDHKGADAFRSSHSMAPSAFASMIWA